MTPPLIDESTVRRIARLARVHLDDASVPELVRAFARMLDTFAIIQGVDVQGCEPLSHPELEDLPRTRADEARDARLVDLLLANAPQREGDAYRVPPAIEGDDA